MGQLHTPINEEPNITSLLSEAGIIGVLLVWGSLPSIQAQDRLEPKRLADPFVLPMWDGNVLKSSQLKGQVIMLEFFQTWCPDCQKAAPEIERIYETIQGERIHGHRYLT